MSVDMGGICWPTRTSTVTRLGSVKLDRQLAYVGNLVEVTAASTDGSPHIGPLEVVLNGRDDTLRTTTSGGSFRVTAPGKYRVTIAGMPAGPLRVL